jgi:hypothetical protein
MTSGFARRLRWHPWSVEARLLAHALRHGLWRSHSPVARELVGEQQVLAWPTAIPDLANASAIVAHLRQSGLRVQEGGNAFYLPPQPGLVATLGAAVARYPRGSGFKILRDFRRLEDAHYLHPERQTRLRRRLIGTPRDQLITANYLHHLGLGPRVWDVCLLRAGRLPMPTFVVQHVDGTAPETAECAAFLQRLRTALSETELRISVPNWERNKDFRCPACNHNLLRDAGGRLSYVDFQNFTVRNPRRMLRPTVDGETGPSSLARWRRLRPAGADDAARRFHGIRRLLGEHGLELTNRLVLDLGCREGAMLHHALADGAWWALGWDRPTPALRAQAVAVASGFTRLDITPAEPNDRYAIGASIPDWLEGYLDESIVFLLAARSRTGIPASLVGLPWRALVYEGHPGESPAAARDHVRAFLGRGVRVALVESPRDVDPAGPPVFLLVREPAAAAPSAVRV